MSESKEIEDNLALAWYEGVYNQEQAQLSAELQSIDFSNVMAEYSRLYELDAREGGLSWN